VELDKQRCKLPLIVAAAGVAAALVIVAALLLCCKLHGNRPLASDLSLAADSVAGQTVATAVDSSDIDVVAGTGEPRAADQPDGMAEGKAVADATLLGLLKGNDQAPSSRSGRPAAGGDCPLDIPSLPSGQYRYQKQVGCEVWRTVSGEGCDRIAEEFLLECRRRGFSLHRATGLDLYGEAWGCLVSRLTKSTKAEVLLVSLIPEVPGIARSEQNKLVVNVIRLTSANTLSELALRPLDRQS